MPTTTPSAELVSLFGTEIASEAARHAACHHRIPLKADVPFKLFFSRPTEASRACLCLFLSAATGRTVTDAAVTNAELLPEVIGAKRPRLDVNCILDGSSRADIELQLTRPGDDQRMRSVYYASRLFSSALHEGARYREAPAVYQIFLLDFDLFGDGAFRHRAKFRLDGGETLAEYPELLFFYLGGQREPGEERLHSIRNWCTFIGGCTEEAVMERLSGDRSWKEEFAMAEKAYRQISEEERTWAYHLSYDRAEVDYRNELEIARETAISEGMQRGLHQAARRALAMGLGAEQAARLSGLPVEEVRQLAAAERR